MRLVVLASLLAGCAPAPVGAPIEGWERAEDPSSTTEAPESVPDHLEWRPTEGTPLFGDGARARWLRASVTCPPDARDPVVFVPKAYVAVAAYVGGRRVGPRRSYRWASGTPWRVVPVACEGEPVVFRVESRYTQLGFPEPPRVGERSAFIERLVPRDATRVALAIAFLLLGLGAGVLAVGGRERAALAGLSVYGLSLAGWTLFHTRSKQLWFPAMEVWFGVWWITVPLIAFGAALFVDAFFGPRRWLRGLWIGYGLVSVAAAASLALDGDAFHTAAAPIFVAGRVLIAIGTVVVVAHLALFALRGDREAALLLAGLAVAFLTVLHDIASSMHWITGDDTWTQYGYGVFGVTLVLLVRRRVTEMQRQLAAHADSLDRYVRERDRLMKDLHDGLGGIVTNVRMLADRGPDDEPRGVLDAISRLAADGVTELRTLLFGFDGPPRTWQQVAAELRRAGGTALDAHDIEHAFVHEITDGAARPELATVVQLLRVHREALTNALKHSGARRVAVRLEVSPERVALSVADDGAGFDPATAKRGKGVSSMRSRAEELGGELTFERDGGTRVRLVVPFS